MTGNAGTVQASALRALWKLREFRSFEQRHFRSIRTLEERDLVWEIGYHHARNAPLTLKQLTLLGTASLATVQRRLRRLGREGVIQHRRAERDRRTVELVLTPEALQAFARYASLLPHG